MPSALASFFSTTEGIGMSSRGSAAAVGIIAGLVSFVVLGCLEGLLMEVLFGSDPSNGFGFMFVLLGAGMILIPANIVAATLIGKRVYREQRRKSEM
jgi:F0F1-type ATP synthase assembly protein I